jgi:L-lactate dehydrogenase complex protein LldE
VGLFVPCYVDQLFPEVGLATVELLEGFGVRVDFPEAQTCCGQMLSNTGFAAEARPVARRFLEVFAGYDRVVCPSGSCVAMVRHHYRSLLGDSAALEAMCGRVFELCEFLTDVLQIGALSGHFPFRVGLHQSCHALRELSLAPASETALAVRDRVRELLRGIEGLSLVELRRADECCGFGGSFSVDEDAVSAMMGRDRVRDHEDAGAEVITAVDMSCLMHLDGIIRRQGAGPRVLHIAELLAAARRRSA